MAAWLGSNPGKWGGSWQRDEVAVRRYIVPALGDRAIGSFGVLQSIMNYAIRLDMLGRTPCRGIDLPKVTPVRRHVVDAAELARLAKGLGGVGGMGPMVYLGAMLGLRWREVAGLRVGRVDTEACALAASTPERLRLAATARWTRDGTSCLQTRSVPALYSPGLPLLVWERRAKVIY